MAIKIKRDFFTTSDGTHIGFQHAGRGKEPFLLCNGLGGTVIAWSPLYEALGDRFQFLAWDYRGLFTSDVPKNRKDLTIEHHVGDALQLLDHLGIKHIMVGGWSMGVQVALEMYRQRPSLVKGLFLINGTYGNAFKTALGSPISKFVLPRVNEVAKKVMGKIQGRIKPIAKMAMDKKQFLDLLVRFGFIHENFNREIFQKIAQDMLETDLAVFHDILEHLNAHNTRDMLSTIRVPTLILAGSKDLMTPPHTAEKMSEQIPGSELLIINSGSHYTLLEFPGIVVQRLKKFLEEHF